MNRAPKQIRFILILSLAIASWSGPSFAADTAPPVPATGKTEETNSQDLLRAYLQLQEQVHSTQLAIERNRQEAGQAAVRSAEALSGRLEAIEQSLKAQRNTELQAIQSSNQDSNRLMLLLAGMFAAIALLAMFLMAFFQWRTVNRLAEISAAGSGAAFAFGSTRPVAALGAGDAHAVTVSPAEQADAAGHAGGGLLNAVERLEKRIHELEHTAHSPLKEPQDNGNSTTNEAKTSPPPEPKTDSATSELKTEPIATEQKTDVPAGHVDVDLATAPKPDSTAVEPKNHEAANDFQASTFNPHDSFVSSNGPSHSNSEPATTLTVPPVTTSETSRINSLLGKGQSLLNVDKAEEALACFDEVLTLDARNAEALVKKGTALERLRKLEEAIDCYNRAIAADGSMTIAYLYKGGLFNRLERFTEAMECYEQALRTQEKV